MIELKLTRDKKVLLSLKYDLFPVFPFCDQMDSQPGMNLPQLFPYPVVNRGWDTLAVGIGHYLDVPQLLHVSNVLDQVITKIVRRYHKTAEIHK